MNIVQFERRSCQMNTVITSREAILNASRQLVKTEGWQAVSIRQVAAACGVSVGSIYNYFDSKSDLTAATVESIWHDIFHFPGQEAGFTCFSDCVGWIFDRLREGGEEYPGFFTVHSTMGFLGDGEKGGKGEEEKARKENAKQRMTQSWEHIQKELGAVLAKDQKVRPGVFNDILTPQKFTEIIFSLIISALIRHNYDDSAVLELVRRTLYG